VVERHRPEVHRIELDDPDVLLDLNRPEEYQEATIPLFQGSPKGASLSAGSVMP
ncbi:MAG: hypothetical protein HY533_01875, partial [Chloroflexi bacterium]|nr:hypothetical protein [Chloroflexota bacterium]